MAHPSLSNEGQIESILAARKLTRKFASDLAWHAGIRDCSLPTLSAALNGRGLKHETGQALLKLLREVDALASLFEPVKIKLEHAGDAYQWLMLIRAGKLRVFTVNDEEELVERHMPGENG